MTHIKIALSGQEAYCQLAPVRLEIGQQIGPAPELYFRQFGQTAFFDILERYRPSHLLPHREAVVLHAGLDALDNAEEGEWLHEMEVPASAAIQRHDVTWANRIALLSAGEPERHTPSLIRDAAVHYWNGTPSEDPVWEYLTTQAIVVAVHSVR